MSDRLAELLQLPPEEQHLIAERLAANVGYILVEEPPMNLPAVAEKGGVTSKMVDEAVALWNAMAVATEKGNPAHKLPKVRKLNPANRKALALRLGEFGADGWRTCVEAIFKSAHCRGINDRGWKADISYLLQPKGSNKTLNGGWPADYQEKTRGGQRTGPARRGDERIDGLRGFAAAVGGHAAAGGRREGRGAQGGEGPEAADGGAQRPQHRLAFGPPDHLE